MTARKALLAAIVSVDIELGEAIHALELLETIEWDFAGSRGELEKFGTLFLVKGADCSPEPLDLRRGGGIIMVPNEGWKDNFVSSESLDKYYVNVTGDLGSVLSVVPPVVNINIWKTRNQKFEFLLIENGNQFGRDDIVESLEEVLHLLLDTVEQLVLDDETDILVLVVLGHGNVPAVRDEIMDSLSTKFFGFNTECLGDNIGDIILQHPHK